MLLHVCFSNLVVNDFFCQFMGVLLLRVQLFIVFNSQNLNFLTCFADMHIEPTTGNYYPTVFFNEFWLLRDKLIAINDTVKELDLHLEVAPISMTKWQLFMQIDQSFQIHRSYGSMLEGEADELKVFTFILLFVHYY